jgi:hypothetical protein
VTAIIPIGLVIAIRRTGKILLPGPLEIGRVLADSVCGVDIAIFILMDSVDIRMRCGWRRLAHERVSFIGSTTPPSASFEFFREIDLFSEPVSRVVVMQYG